MMLAPNPETGLRAEALSVGYGDRAVLERVALHLPRGGITALVGPNGSGKSTLLKALARIMAPSGGTVLLEGQAIARLPSAEVARRLAVLPQAPVAPAGMTVAELVEQGRYPHAGPLRMLRRQDHDAIRDALAATGMTGFAGRALDELSGGERQRAWIALTLAQDTPWLLLDEPTTFLDIGHQLEVLELVARLNRERGITVLMVLHDLAQAARFADRLVVLHGGRLHSEGPPGTVLTPAMLAEVFRIEARIIPDAETGRPHMLPIRHLPDGAPAC
ncbi:ABC transporter ATP-binding protein [Roseococcus sp. SDR]|uniref:ABC transporter ATP-binding protein n=1 Tax=Roseococcus sp. SDR TaxID=2835532 RepID=UPI001BCAEEF8|nr:ABC transporter ATP-binding protein [Roseococcus sp. SDR]MBS7792341.1 ABC transporter ATP-binding protein [Roseococcus sp. SDR]MBV1847655.1 ABC transporter ATP-binding protein [Roseococcus sp. SDR]